MKSPTILDIINHNSVIYSLSNDILKLPVVIKPQARKNQIIGVINGRLKIAIAAVATGGNANKELINFIAKILVIKKQEVIIASGTTSQLKMLHLPTKVQYDLDHILT